MPQRARRPRRGGPLFTIQIWCGAALLLSGCIDRPVEKVIDDPLVPFCELRPLFVDKEVDLLFVIDNSDSMDWEQKNLSRQFPKLIEALRTVKLGSDGSGKPCTATNQTGCRIPNVHIGVVSTDLGAGSQTAIPGCSSGGDKGKLQTTARSAGCTTPSNAWIEYDGDKGKTNITGSAATAAVEAVKGAFSCIAELGTGGCGFEHTLEASRQALDLSLNRNPGFLRNETKSGKDALLAVVFITDEDDCSAADGNLFDPTQQSLGSPLGPLHSFRCFEFGVKCDCAPSKCTRTLQGARRNCVPAKPAEGSYLHDVDSYVKFFSGIKKTPDGKDNPRRVLLTAIAGPTERVEVGLDGSNPSLKYSCNTGEAQAVPAIRLKHVVHSLAQLLTDSQKTKIEDLRKQYPGQYKTDAAVCQASQGNPDLLGFSCFEHPTSKMLMLEGFSRICTNDFSPALKALGEQIVASLGTMCLTQPVLADNGGVLCSAGDVVGTDSAGRKVVCQQSCLDQAELMVQQVTAGGRKVVKKCPARLFAAAVRPDQCGSDCPCWRIVPDEACRDLGRSSPYAVEIMRKGEAPKGTYADICAPTSGHAWGSAALAELPQCG